MRVDWFCPNRLLVCPGRLMRKGHGMSYENNAADQLLMAPDAARYVSLSPSTLAKMRMRGDGPKFIRLSANRVGYRRSDIEAWLKSCERTSTLEDKA